MSTFTFDTHAFVKAFINAKTDEEKAEVLAKTIAETREDGAIKIEKKFEKANDALATKDFVRTIVLESKNDTIKWMFGMFLAFSSAQLGIFMLILKFFFKGVGGV